MEHSCPASWRTLKRRGLGALPQRRLDPYSWPPRAALSRSSVLSGCLDRELQGGLSMACLPAVCPQLRLTSHSYHNSISVYLHLYLTFQFHSSWLQDYPRSAESDHKSTQRLASFRLFLFRGGRPRSTQSACIRGWTACYATALTHGRPPSSAATKLHQPRQHRQPA